MLQKLRGKNAKGFTLIELMIVIAIIGILMAIAIPNFIAYRDKSFCSSAEADANNVAATLADYFAIPTRTTVPEVTDQSGYLGIAMTNDNTVTVAEGTDSIVITVTEAANRCPTDYMDALDKWDSSAYTYTINMD
jgi:type IV pilus assembly protein PilA